MAVPLKRPATAAPARPDIGSESNPPPPKRLKPRRKKAVPGRKPGRPRKAAPLGLADLPVEIVGRIASFLLPPLVTAQNGFLPPGTMPYSGPRLKSPTAKVKTSAYGGIPSGIKDIMALALSCRHCDAGVELVMGRMGDGKSKGKKRTMYITLPDEIGLNYTTPTEGTLDKSSMVELYQRIAASSETLENIVFHQCPHVKDGKVESSSSSCFLKYMKPFQAASVDFPNLLRLQVGPNTCEPCSFALLQLFLGRTYLREKKGHPLDDPDHSLDGERSEKYEHVYHLGEPARLYGGSSDHEVDTYDYSAAPNLSHLEVFIAEKAYHRAAHDDIAVTELLKFIPDDNTLEMVQIWLHENEPWGGFGVCGSSRAHPVKDSKLAEEELEKWAKQEKGKGMSVQERMLAKFKADAAEELVKLKSKRPVVGRLGGKQVLTGTIKDSTTDKRREVDQSGKVFGSSSGSALEPMDGSAGPSKSNEVDKRIGQMDTVGSDAGDGVAEDQKDDDEKGDDERDDDEKNDDEKEDAGKEEDSKEDDEKEDDSVAQDDALGSDLADSTSIATSNDQKKGKSNAARHAEYSHRRMARSYTFILRAIANKFPNLVGLSLQRRGTYRIDIAEGFNYPADLADLFVIPLKKLEKLVHLDLGLAICGAKEVSDFPLGLSVHATRKGREKAKSADTDIQSLKRRKYEQDIKKAIEEGDSWRKEVLGNFVIPPEKSKGEGDEQEEEVPPRWPPGVNSGHIVSVDLNERMRSQGVAIEWKVVGREIVLGQPRQIKL